MGNCIVTEAELTAVADSIRAKSGGSSPLAWPTGFQSEVAGIQYPALQNQAGAFDMRSGVSAYDGAGNVIQGALINLHQPISIYWDDVNDKFTIPASVKAMVEHTIQGENVALGALFNSTTSQPIPVVVHPSTTEGKWTMTGGVTTGNNDDKYATQARIDPDTGVIEAEATYYIRAITTLSRNIADWMADRDYLVLFLLV